MCGIDSPGTQWVLILVRSVLGQLWDKEHALRCACLHTAFLQQEKPGVVATVEISGQGPGDGRAGFD